MNANTQWKLMVLGLGVVALLGISAYSGTTQNIRPEADATPIAIGDIVDSELFNGTATVTVRQLTIHPGEILPWHHHPGRAYNVVKSGTLTTEDGCAGEETLTAGQAFEEVSGRIHRAKNLGTEDVVVINTFIVPKGMPTTINTANNERLCGPPENVDQCKNDGWMIFTYPRTFSSKGDCTKFVRTGN